jgi:hypothetical protein
MVKVVSVRDAKLEGFTYFYVGRKSSYKPVYGKDWSALGNPFWMSDESQRNKVCEQYKIHFKGLLIKHQKSLEMLKERHIKGENIALVCFCAPKRCHGDTIKEYLEEPKIGKELAEFIDGVWTNGI